MFIRALSSIRQDLIVIVRSASPRIGTTTISLDKKSDVNSWLGVPNLSHRGSLASKQNVSGYH